MATTTEPTINTHLAAALRRQHPHWRGDAIRSQSTRVVVGAPGLQPDLLVRVPAAAPIVLEAEVAPARAVEAEARDRIGAVSRSGHTVETAVALRYPQHLRSVPEADLPSALSAARFEWCSWRENRDDPDHAARFPGTGWLDGALSDLAGSLEAAAASQRLISSAASELEAGVEAAAEMLGNLPPPVQEKLSALLSQSPGEQTMRMAAAVMTNALLFQVTVAAAHGADNLDETRAASGDPSLLGKADVLAVWRQILDINYWPIFDIASRLLLPIPAEPEAGFLLDLLAKTAERLQAAGLLEVQGLAGQMFGELISDRKFLATFYTLPASATLLAELAVSRLDSSTDWGAPGALIDLRVADLACGTGALLSALYHRIASRVRRAGLDDRDSHTQMMERVLIGADIMPAAAHLTTTMLSAVHPEVTFGTSGVHLLPFGREGGGGVAVGSLELMGDRGTVSLFGRSGTKLAGRGEDVVSSDGADRSGGAVQIADGSLDLCIMNPPFTRATNHTTDERSKTAVPSFAGFGAGKQDQRDMSARVRGLGKLVPKDQRCGHGNAGLASNFIDLAHAKLRPGGVLGLILPLAVTSGPSWAGTRRLLRTRYEQVAVAGIATAAGGGLAFSADTGMAEVMLVARKRPEDVSPGTGGTGSGGTGGTGGPVSWISLRNRPGSIVEALETARAIAAASPAGGAGGRQNAAFRPLELGGDLVGYRAEAGVDCALTGYAEPDVARAARHLNLGPGLWLRGRRLAPLPLCPLGEIGRPGPVDRDVNGRDARTGKHRGPFDVKGLEPGKTPSYPVLWAHDAGSGRESRILVMPDRQGRVRVGMDDKARRIWATATRLHVNRDFRLNSQPTGACLTPEPAIGGSAWPSFRLDDPAWEPLVALWLNTTPGLAGRWLASSRQQLGRARLSVTRLHELTVLDPRRLSDRQVGQAAEIFDAHCEAVLLPAHESHRDLARCDLDEAVLCSLVGLPRDVMGPLARLRRQWCEEPLVHGGRGAGFDGG